MKKIVTFGNSGAGKTTLAKNLQNQYQLDHLDLDTVAWQDVVTPVRKHLAQSIVEINLFLAGSDNWVIEGCYADLLTHVARRANEMIFLNLGIETCIRHCRARAWEPHKYASKEDQDNNLDMLIDWVKQYEQRDDEFSLKAHKALFESFIGNKVEIKEAEHYSLIMK